jgi:hypothetical protein
LIVVFNYAREVSMKTHSVLCVLAVWALIVTVSYGQDEHDVQRWKNHRLEEEQEVERIKAETKAEDQKNMESGRHLFGASKNWTEDEMEGTLAKKQPPDFEIGDWGCIRNALQVVNTVSKTECLVTIIYYKENSRSLREGNEKHYSEVMLLRGLKMSKVTDRVTFILQHPVVIQDTYRYTAASGSPKTVLVLECNSSKLKEIEVRLETNREARQKAAIEQAKAKKDREAAIEAAKWRTWTVSDGTNVEAKFGGLMNSTVILTKRDGSKLKVPLAELSAEDREWIAKRRK